MADLGDIVKKHLHFLKALPHVKPFYAVKCNSSKGVVRTLAELGAGFDCASKVGIRGKKNNSGPQCPWGAVARSVPWQVVREPAKTRYGSTNVKQA